MATPRSSRRGLVWAIIGAAVLLVAIIAIVASSMLGKTPVASPTVNQSPRPNASQAPTDPPPESVVDESVIQRGWIAEPITKDSDLYIQAALAAASTFDTQQSTRAEWLSYLDTWFTPDTRYATEQEREDDMRASQLELRQGVVLPEADWNSLANENGRVTADAAGEIAYTDVPEDSSGNMRIGTTDVVLTFTRSDSGGKESSYDEKVRVSVQVLCGDGSVPAPNSDQQPGDCKVVRYFSGSLEP
ncbi:hypothetical protein [Microbacterium deminutum]|uniref:Secreted protein n=1 Tax=Microbacterium deminutum TaxID=344164 RepID=A0ABN2RH61_9MICO